MHWVVLIVGLVLGQAAFADVVVPVKTLRAGTLLTQEDITLRPDAAQSGIALSDVIGMETRVVLYAGRPIRAEDVMPPALVQRNQIVPLVFAQSGLSISTYGRVLDRGAAGDLVRVMNLASHTTLFGTVDDTGSVRVSR